MSLPASSSSSSMSEDAYDREPFVHPDLERLNRLIEQPIPDMLNLDAVATVARQAGLIQVLRWKPKMVREDAPRLDFTSISQPRSLTVT